ncbi:MAG: NUDIX domain-containing protein, partial [Janthinobacterium lividum]
CLDISIKNTSIHNLARAVIIKNDHILLGYDPRSKPIHYYEPGARFYYLPRGHIEFKESAKAALIREIQEEIGHTAIIERYLGSIENNWSFDGDSIYYHTHEVNHIFKCDVLDIDPKIELPQVDADVAFHWVKLNELYNINLRPVKLKELIPTWLSQDLNNAWCSLIN